MAAAARLVPGFRPAEATPGPRPSVWFVTDGSGESAVVKFHAGDPRRQLGKERFVYELAAPLDGLPTPRVLGFDEEAMALSVVPGVGLDTVIDKLSSAEIDSLSEQLGAAIATLHTLAQPAFGYLLTWVHEPADRNRDYLESTLESFFADWSRYGGDAALAGRLKGFIAERADLFDRCSQPVVCHDDIHPANLLVTPAEEDWVLSGLVDFENARAADPLMDVAKAGYYLFSSLSNRLSRAAFVRGYGGLPDHAETLIPVYRVWSDLEMWVSLAKANTIGWRPALESDLAELVAGTGW